MSFEKIFVTGLLAFTALGAVFVSDARADRNPGPREGVYPFSGVDPALPDGDLRPLDGLIAGTRLFGIAESAHDSSGYKKTQHRLVRYLVEKKGFRLLIVEDPILRSEPLHEYLRSCELGAVPPVSVLDDPMQEDVDLIEWFCEFNRAHPKDPVVFRGEDIWDRPWELQARAERIDAELALGFATELATARRRCGAHDVTNWDAGTAFIGKIYASPEKKIPDEDFIPCAKALEKMQKRTEAELGALFMGEKRRYALHTFLQTVETLFAWQNVWNLIYRENDEAWSFRDRAQARNILSILAQEGNRKAIWVTHVSHGSKKRSDANWGGMTRNFTTGYYLDRAMGSDFRIAALSAYHVVGKEDYTLPTSPDSLDLIFHERRIGSALVDLRGSFVRAKRKWWIQNENNSDFPNGVLLVPKDHFDWLIFVDETLRGTPVLPWIDPFFG